MDVSGASRLSRAQSRRLSQFGHSAFATHGSLRFSRVPPSINGMALGLCGLGGLWTKVGISQGQDFNVLICAIYIWAFVLYCVYVPTKWLFCFRKVCEELQDPPSVGAIAATPMTTMLLGAQCYNRVNNTAGYVMVCAGGALQVLCMFHFVRLIITKRVKPETYWFPPTVSIAVTALTGCAVGWPQWAYLGCFYAAIALKIVTLPCVSLRVGMNPQSSSMGPGFNMLCAPASLNSLVWHLVGKPHGSGFGFVLWVLSSIFWAQTFWGLYQRRASWAQVEFSPAWAAFTFPLASSCQAALYAFDEWFVTSWCFYAYTWAVIWLCNLVFFHTHVNYYFRFSSWLREPLPVAPGLPDRVGAATYGCPGRSVATVAPRESEQEEEEEEAPDIARCRAQSEPTLEAAAAAHAIPPDECTHPVVAGRPPLRRSNSISIGALQMGKLPVTEGRARELLNFGKRPWLDRGNEEAHGLLHEPELREPEPRLTPQPDDVSV